MAACAAISSATIPHSGRGHAANKMKTVTAMICMKTGPGWLSRKKPSSISLGRRFFTNSMFLTDGQAIHHRFKPLRAYFVTCKSKGDTHAGNGSPYPEHKRDGAHIPRIEKMDNIRNGVRERFGKGQHLAQGWLLPDNAESRNRCQENNDQQFWKGGTQ